MRYIKVLVLVLLFFLSMVFFFQNQAPLSQEIVLTLNLFFIPQMTSIGLPIYLISLAAFALGAILALLVLVWDKVNLTARLMKSGWQVHALEKEVQKLTAAQQQTPARSGLGFFRKPAAEAKEQAAPAAAETEPAAEK